MKETKTLTLGLSFSLLVFSLWQYYSSLSTTEVLSKALKTKVEIIEASPKAIEALKLNKTEIENIKKTKSTRGKSNRNITEKSFIAENNEIKKYKFGLNFEEEFFTNHKDFDCCEIESTTSFFDNKLERDGSIEFYLAVTEKEYQLFHLIAEDSSFINRIQTYTYPKVDYIHDKFPIVLDGDFAFLPVKPFKDRVSGLLKKINREGLNCINLVLKAFPKKIVDNISTPSPHTAVGIYCRTKVNGKFKSYKLTHGLLINKD